MPKLIKDLGLIHTGSKRVHFAIYSCPQCLIEFTTRCRKDLSCDAGICRRCASINNATKHGHSSNSLYSIYKGMVVRCESLDRKDSEYYSAKGISVCRDWITSFEAFSVWAASSGYRTGLSIERLSNDKGYEPENCCWIPKTKQSINRGVFSNNTSGFKGVSLMPKHGKFKAYIGVNKKVIYLGLHATAEIAAAAYDDYVIANGLAHPLNLPLRQ